MSVKHRLHDMGDVWRVVSLVRSLPKTNQTGEALLMLADHVERLEREQKMLITVVAQARAEEGAKYDELLLAVAKKCPGETRHETALRYIREAEAPRGEAASAAAIRRRGEGGQP